MKKLIVSLTLALAAFPALAQNAEQMFDKLLQSIRQDGISCEGTIRNADDTNDPGNKVSLVMKAEKYCIRLSESTYWYDGKYGWNGIGSDYNINEVYISEPDDDELSSNPFVLLMNREAFNISATDGRTLALTAKDQVKGVYGALSLKLRFTDEGRPLQITMDMLISEKSRNVFRTVTDISSFKTSVTDDSVFTFQKSKWPDAEIIDLR